MELSRFDAAAEQVEPGPVDLAGLVTRPSSRLASPRPWSTCPPTGSSSTRTRGGSSGSSATSSTTPASTPPARRSRSARENDRAVTLTVEDRGPGVPADRLGRIFERFYKADPSRHGGSSGLGLAIAAEHAALLGGRLRARNRDGGGLAIELVLPVTGSLHGGDVAETHENDGEGR